MDSIVNPASQASPDSTNNWKRLLLLTKLHAPRPAADDVIRSRLLHEVERGADRKLTLVVTPAGYGKTTLLSRWQQRTERASGWLTLDSGDNDFRVFMEYFVAAIQSIDPCVCLETAALLDGPSQPPTQLLIQSVLNEVAESTRPFVLILDDYHVISSPEVHSAVTQIIQGMPVNMAIVIASRQEPDLPTLKMSARGELVELGTFDLSFLETETAEFLLQRQQLDLITDQIEKISDWAEGWPVALRLISRVLRGRTHDNINRILESLSDNVPSIRNYLWDEVIENRPPEERMFLLQTSILQQFNYELAAAVTDRQDAAVLVGNLARDNLFVARLDGPGNWYRYHHIFSDVLQQRLGDAVAEAEVLELHRRAAGWFERNDYINEAARHAILARDWEPAARHLIGICQELYDQERIGSLRAWLSPLPREPFERESKLAYWLAWAQMRTGHRQDAAWPISLAGDPSLDFTDPSASQASLQLKLLTCIYDWDAAAGQEGGKILLDRLPSGATADRSRTHIMLGLLQATGGNLSEAAASLESARLVNERIGIRGLHVLELVSTAQLLRAAGKLREPSELFRRTVAIGDEWNDLPVQHAHHQLGTILLEWNRLDEARAHARAAIDLSEKMGTPIHLPLEHALLAGIAWAEERWNDALDEIERSISLAIKVEAWGPLRVLEKTQCRIWLATNQLDRAERWLDRVGAETLESLRYEELPTTLAAMRIRMHQDRSKEIVQPLERLQDLARRHGWYLELLSIQTLRAMAEGDLGNVDAARTAIEDALDIGAPEGFMRSYLIEGPRVLPALRLAAREGGPQREHAMSLLALAGEDVPAARAPRNDAPSILSSRERDVMRLVGSGLSNRDVGNALFISEETVKTHLRRIFEKLDVSSRTQAINRCQQLGLL